MNARKEDNLRELFERFVGTEEAERCIEDIIKAERILDENPAPGPGEELIAAVNNRIAEELRLRKEHNFRRFAYRLAPVAAVFIVIAAVGVQMLFREGGGPEERFRGPIISARVWNSEDVAADDRNLVVLTTELDELEVEFATLESEENGAGSSSAVTELEIEFAEINGNIWEG
jgi:hypothetical protein